STTLELLHKRSSCRDYSGKPLEQKKLFSLLERISTYRKSERGPRKLYANGGAIYENQFYYLSLNTENLEDGFYYIHEKIKRIEPLQTCPDAISIIRERFLPNSWSSHSQGYLFVTSSLGQRMFKYKGISLRHALVNVGAIIDFIYINCTDLDLSCCAHGSWSGGKFFNKILGNDFFSNPILGVVGIGHAAEK
ncbi:MAG: nitroreductase family protein, partial [Bacteriovoracaceae bacterium]|nr:nitroreductase family protein [Bacteriovoracaceae bacterium]